MLTKIKLGNSNQENDESYLHGYKNGYEYAKVKLIEDACEWLEAHVHEHIIQVDSDVWIDEIQLGINFREAMKN